MLRYIQKQLQDLQTSHTSILLNSISLAQWNSSKPTNRQLKTLRCSNKNWAQHQVHAVKTSSHLGTAGACAAACRPLGV